jgi:hypothetical protein
MRKDQEYMDSFLPNVRLRVHCFYWPGDIDEFVASPESFIARMIKNKL